MVEFDGVELCDVAPVRVMDVFVSSPSVEVTALDVPLRAGAHFVRRKLGMRTVTATFVLLEPDEEKRRRYLADIVAWASSERECRLRSTPELEGYLMAVCSQYPDQSSREFWEVLTLVFTAVDPRYTGCAENVCPVSGRICVTRHEQPALVIRQTVDRPLSSPAWRLGDDCVRLSGQVLPGELTIDFDCQSVMLNGDSIAGQVTIESTFFSLQRGANQIICENGAGGVAYWRERWI